MSSSDHCGDGQFYDSHCVFHFVFCVFFSNLCLLLCIFYLIFCVLYFLSPILNVTLGQGCSNVPGAGVVQGRVSRISSLSDSRLFTTSISKLSI